MEEVKTSFDESEYLRTRDKIGEFYTKEPCASGIHYLSSQARYHKCNGRYTNDPLYGDGRAGQRIAELLAEVPLHIEKRLTY